MAQVQDSFGARARFESGGQSYEIFRLDAVDGSARLPYSLKILMENLLRHEDGVSVRAEDIRALAGGGGPAEARRENAFRAGGILMEDFTGGPGVGGLGAMRDAMRQ